MHQFPLFVFSRRPVNSMWPELLCCIEKMVR